MKGMHHLVVIGIIKLGFVAKTQFLYVEFDFHVN